MRIFHVSEAHSRWEPHRINQNHSHKHTKRSIQSEIGEDDFDDNENSIDITVRRIMTQLPYVEVHQIHSRAHVELGSFHIQFFNFIAKTDCISI